MFSLATTSTLPFSLKTNVRCFCTCFQKKKEQTHTWQMVPDVIFFRRCYRASENNIIRISLIFLSRKLLVELQLEGCRFFQAWLYDLWDQVSHKTFRYIRDHHEITSRFCRRLPSLALHKTMTRRQHQYLDPEEWGPRGTFVRRGSVLQER